MGCTTNGFVLTKEKNPFKIWRMVEPALIAEMEKETGLKGWELWNKTDDKFSRPNCDLSEFGMLTISFTFAGEERNLNIHFECDSDYAEYKKGKKLITSLGAWGQSVRLTEVVLRALSDLGSTHIVNNDCYDDWRELK